MSLPLSIAGAAANMVVPIIGGIQAYIQAKQQAQYDHLTAQNIRTSASVDAAQARTQQAEQMYNADSDARSSIVAAAAGGMMGQGNSLAASMSQVARASAVTDMTVSYNLLEANAKSTILDTKADMDLKNAALNLGLGILTAGLSAGLSIAGTQEQMAEKVETQQRIVDRDIARQAEKQSLQQKRAAEKAIKASPEYQIQQKIQNYKTTYEAKKVAQQKGYIQKPKAKGASMIDQIAAQRDRERSEFIKFLSDKVGKEEGFFSRIGSAIADRIRGGSGGKVGAINYNN